jgi:hypothetical protein
MSPTQDSTFSPSADTKLLASLYAYHCEQCNQQIPWNELLLLRDSGSTPNAPDKPLHRTCLASYVAHHEGAWKKMVSLPGETGRLMR